jgi:hypothetical protein
LINTSQKSVQHFFLKVAGKVLMWPEKAAGKVLSPEYHWKSSNSGRKSHWKVSECYWEILTVVSSGSHMQQL